MVRVSNAFKQKIYATERYIHGRVSFEILDVDAYEDAQITASGEASISRLNQSINKKRDMTHKYATFERDYFKLDGNSHIPPTPDEGDSELGWWSDVIAGDDGVFVVSPTIEFLFDEPHDSIGLTFTFDRQANEYPAEFKIEAFDGTDALILSETITGNQTPYYIFETPISDYRRLLITILKWAVPFRRARITEIDFGIIREYTGDKLISLKVLEEMDLLASTAPSNELQFVIDNSDNLFNIMNPNGIYGFLQPNQEMSADLGLKLSDEATEYIGMGKYFLDEWTVDEGAMTATFIGRDIFTKLDLVDYTNLLQNTSLYDLAVDVLTQANIKKFTVDEQLKNITTKGFFAPIKAREALQMIAIAGRSVINQDRNGFINLRQFEELTFETGFITFAGPDFYPSLITYPEIYIDYTFQAIDFDNTFEVPKITLAPQVSQLVFKITDTPEIQTDLTVINAQIKEGQGFEINNPLINTEAHALDVAGWMFREYSLVALYQASWRQNPALECGNVILIEDSFGGKKKARITKQEFSYEGYLDGITDAKGGV